jgi:hypothetical protein
VGGGGVTSEGGGYGWRVRMVCVVGVVRL